MCLETHQHCCVHPLPVTPRVFCCFLFFFFYCWKRIGLRAEALASAPSASPPARLRSLAVKAPTVRAKVQTNWVITHGSQTLGRNDRRDVRMRGSGGGGSRADITQMTEQTRLILWTRRRVEEQRLFYTVLGGGGRFSGQLGERNKALTSRCLCIN